MEDELCLSGVVVVVACRRRRVPSTLIRLSSTHPQHKHASARERSHEATMRNIFTAETKMQPHRL